MCMHIYKCNVKPWGHSSFKSDTLVRFGESRLPSRQPIGIQIQDRLSEAGKLGSLERLGQVVTLHLVCRAVLYLYVALLHLVHNKEVTDVDVP